MSIRNLSGVIVLAALENDEMWRKGTIELTFTLGKQVEFYHLSPPDIEAFRSGSQNPKIIEFIKLDDWISEALTQQDLDELDNLVWDLIEKETTFTFWVSGLTLTDMEEICDDNGLDWGDLRESLEARFTKDGHPCGIDSDDPFHNPSNRLNPRNN